MSLISQRFANVRAVGNNPFAGRTISLEDLLKLRFCAANIPLFNRKQVATSQTGGYASLLRGRGMDFVEVRTYQTGDDIRHMDWRVTARTGRPHTKLYQEERERPVFFIVDYSASMFFGTRVSFKSVVAAKAASLLAFAAAAQNNKVGSILFSGNRCHQLPARDGHYGVLPLLNLLADTEKPLMMQQKPGDLAKALTHLRHMARPGSLLVLLSDFTSFDEAAKVSLYELASHHDIVTGFIYDPLEAEPPPPHDYLVTNGTVQLAINSRNGAWCDAYRQQFLAHKKVLSDLCKHQQIPFLELCTRDDVAKSLINFFKML